MRKNVKIKIKYLYKEQKIELKPFDKKGYKSQESVVTLNDKIIFVGTNKEAKKFLPEIKELTRVAIYIKNCKGYPLEDFIEINKKDWYSRHLNTILDVIKPTKKEVVPAPKKMSKKTKSILAGLGIFGVATGSLVGHLFQANSIQKTKDENKDLKEKLAKQPKETIVTQIIKKVVKPKSKKTKIVESETITKSTIQNESNVPIPRKIEQIKNFVKKQQWEDAWNMVVEIENITKKIDNYDYDMISGYIFQLKKYFETMDSKSVNAIRLSLGTIEILLDNIKANYLKVGGTF